MKKQDIKVINLYPNESKMLKVGIIELGFWGETCITYILRMNHIKLVGIFASDEKKAQDIASTYFIPRYDYKEQLIDECDALIIANPSLFHYDIVSEVIRRGKHFFIEYPVFQSIEEYRLWIQLIKEAKVKCQIGVVELFNPAYKQVQKYIQEATFVDITHVLSVNSKTLSLNILLEILPQDIYVLLDIIRSPLKNIYANAIHALTDDNYDLVNVRLEFLNGCTANLTISRVSEKETYKINLFQSNAQIKVDFLAQQSEVIFFNKIKNATFLQEKQQSYIEDKITFQSFSKNKVSEELESFFNAIIHDHSTCINEFDGLKVFEINQEIIKQITQKK